MSASVAPPLPGRHSYKVEGTNINFAHGTTCLAFRCNGFAIAAADSRSTQGETIASQAVTKLIKINDYIISTMAGSAADCQYWSRYVGSESQLFELRNKRRMTVAGASKFYSNILIQYKGRDLSVGSMIVGYDDFGADLFYIDNDGQRVRGDIFACGSGSTFALSVLDQEFRPDLTEDEAVELARKSIYHATHRDSGTGGQINVIVINEKGTNWVVKQDNFELFHKYINDPSPYPLQ
ncbi:putative Proteasome subunit beta type-5 [Blattamonas nauphoetae]|uniref:Proteasome subunit beta n=1 Tax=Blattamonas nauphoetae TaxID=2049346 RepID=A0ABQ9YFN7_9EUKA|nr:putative Proteasome subunit beta type-5 [Blattamonas nauphoetae]